MLSFLLKNKLLVPSFWHEELGLCLEACLWPWHYAKPHRKYKNHPSDKNWDYLSPYHSAPYPRKYGAFNKVRTPEQWQVSYFYALVDLKRIKKNHNAIRVWGNLAFISPPCFQPWDERSVAGWELQMSLLLLSLLMQEEKTSWVGRSIQLPSLRKSCLSTLTLCPCLACSSSGGRNKRNKP